MDLDFAIEYERTQKTVVKYKEISSEYCKYYDPKKWFFIYLCETPSIEIKIKELMKMENLKIVNSQDFMINLKGGIDYTKEDFATLFRSSIFNKNQNLFYL